MLAKRSRRSGLYKRRPRPNPRSRPVNRLYLQAGPTDPWLAIGPPISMLSAYRRVGRRLEAIVERQHVRIAERDELGQDDPADAGRPVDPEIRVGKAGPGEASGASA